MEMPRKIVGRDADCSETEISSDPPGRCWDRTWNYSQGRSWRRGWRGGRVLRHVTDEAARSGRVQGAKVVTNWISEVKIIDIMRSTIFILLKQITKNTISNCNFIWKFTISVRVTIVITRPRRQKNLSMPLIRPLPFSSASFACHSSLSFQH